MSEEAHSLGVLAGRYLLGEVIGRGGAATVHLGKPITGSREGVVAIKRLHPHLASDPAFLAMMLDEARLLSRVVHPNVVSTLDVVMERGELYVVMEHVHGVTLGALLGRVHARKERPRPAIVCAIARDVLLGLHAAHEATGPSGERLSVVHRDVSPQNLLVSKDGEIKVVDFGIAKAEGRVQHTEDGSIKGKLGYMPPEQLYGEALDRRADVYAVGVVLWEALVGERLFAGNDGGPALVKSLVAQVEPPSARVSDVSGALDRVVLRALAHEVGQRFQTAEEMANALLLAQVPAEASDVAAWVRDVAGDVLRERGEKLSALEHAAHEFVMPLPMGRENLVSVGVSARRNARKSWAWALVAALCATLGGSLAVVLGRPSNAVDAPSATALPGIASAKAVSAAVSSATTTDTLGAVALDVDAGAATAQPVAEVPLAAPTVQNTARSSRTPLAKPTPKADGCDPPFTIDAQGHKRYKRDCLR